MFAVGIDVSNGYSTAVVFRTKTDMVIKPFDFLHTADGFSSLIEKLKALDGDIKVTMECTGRYYESVAMSLNKAGFFVATLNPLVLKKYQTESVSALSRRIKRMPESLRNSPLTTGMNCRNMLLWIRFAMTSKP